MSSAGAGGPTSMRPTFPGESAEYRAARDGLLARELELRRAMEAVAVARRALPAGGTAPEDYVFQAAGPTPVRMSELFAPGTDTLVVYNFMFPRDRSDDRPGPRGAGPHCCRSWRARARRARRSLTSSTGRPTTSPPW